MRLLTKLALKLVKMLVMVALLGALFRYGQPLLMKSMGVEGMPMPNGAPAAGKGMFSSEESDLMATVLKSALRLVMGTSSRKELAGELSDKLYSQRAGAGEMAELGIEIVKPGEGAAPAAPGTATKPAQPAGPGIPALAAAAATVTPQAPAGPGIPDLDAPATSALPNSARASVSTRKVEAPRDPREEAFLRVWSRIRPISTELALAPVVLVGMVVTSQIRRRRAAANNFEVPSAALLAPAETEVYEMKNAVQTFTAEEFELLVAELYQRQGYRITMPAALSGGRGPDFQMQRKAEKVLVQCKKVSADHKISLERVKEMHEAMALLNLTKGIYVASCGFTWDARNFGKANGITLISARILDEQINVAQQSSEEDLLQVSTWVSKCVGRIQFTTPTCPACEAPMDQIKVSEGSVWACSQRPDCKGRRGGRKYQKEAKSSEATATDTASEAAV